MIKQYNCKELGADFFDAPAADMDEAVTSAVSAIIAQVKARGDAAVLEYTARFDGAALEGLMVTQAEIDVGVAATPPDLLAAMEEAAVNIRAFHKLQLNGGFRHEREDGVVLGQRVTPIERVGIYVPGGTASYPSTVLMNAIPAKIAGVSRLSMVTPPGRDGAIAPAILAAARVAGVDRIYKCGGAQAVAALAYGTETVERVYKITGPGNIYVAAAKRLAYGLVDIDMIAGPSDVLIIADETAKAAWLAADMLAQAEHDALARAVLVTTSEGLAADVTRELERQLAALPRREIAEAAINGRSAIVIADGLDEAADFANCLAPEHLELCVAEPWALFEKTVNAGSVFLGHHTPEALGDYFAGPNHTLPTMGTARFASALSVDDFVKRSGYTAYTPQALAAVAVKVALFARAEGLDGHALSAEIRGV